MVGFRDPVQTFETFRLAFRGDLLDLEYRCLSSGFQRRNQLSQLGYREFRDELVAQEPLLRLALHKAEVVEIDRGTTRSRIVARAWRATFVLDFVREDFWEIWGGSELLADASVDDMRAEGYLRASKTPDGTPWLVGQIPLEGLADPERITEARIGSEWKIDDFQVIDSDELEPGAATAQVP